MPELPEVETVRRQLAATLIGRRIDAVRATGARSVRRHNTLDELGSMITNASVVRARRRGKYLLIDLDNDTTVVVHLRMSGQLLLVDQSAPVVIHTHVVLQFGADELRFVDPRTFGEVTAIATGDVAMLLPALGPEPWDIEPADFARSMRKRRTSVKAALLDQRTIAGVGNIYADESLWRACIDPRRMANSTGVARLEELLRRVQAVLTEAIERRGSSLADLQYVDLFGEGGTFQARHDVHARAGQPCNRCGTSLKRGVVAARGTTWCPTCQR